MPVTGRKPSLRRSLLARVKSSSRPAPTVAYLGPEGTFAHAVALRRASPGSHFLPEPDIRSVFESVLAGRASSGIVPMENSSAGWIYETIDLLIGHAPKIHITHEHSLDVKLAFVGHQGRPIKKIYSHFAPLKHNEAWLAKHHPNAELIACPSTAHAAKQAQADESAAAITSRSAAKLHALDVLTFPLGAEEANVTRFVEIARHDGPTGKGSKTGLVVTLKNKPGSLLAFLRPFSTAHLNLSGIVSRPIPGQPSAHRFLIEADGSSTRTKIAAAVKHVAKAAVRLVANPGRKSGAKTAVKQAAKSAVSLISLGHYSATPRIKD